MVLFSNDPDEGLFVPTTNIWDVSEIYETEVTSPAFKELIVRLYQNINAISTALNIKDSAYYTLSEFLNGQLFFPPSLASSNTEPVYRQDYRLVVNFGALPNAAAKSVAHGLAVGPTWTFTRIYACTSNSTATSFLPIPYASVTDVAHNIELEVTNTNVIITTGIDRTAYTTTYVILEYLKN